MKALWLILGVIGTAALLLIVNHDSGTLFGMDNDRFGSMVYFSVWALVIAAALFTRRGQWREMARNIVLWLAIILILMAGYLYRYDLQDFGARLTGGLIPGSPISDTYGDGQARITLIRGNDDHFHARAQVNGASVTFLVDTGASSVVLSANDAERAGIDIDRLSYTTPVTTANGRTTAAQIRLDSLDIGAIHRPDVMAMVARPGALNTSLLGMNYLSTLSSFDFRGDRLILTD
ncbi:MAG: TIGR02281 family clan AA aspartic protease [Salaquimonas sp.]|nr:TIGR02281 family clan AA aspartic protease [Salaquimonas sp.]